MAINPTAFETKEKTVGQGGFMDALLLMSPHLTATDLQPFADQIAALSRRILEEIKNNADVTGVTSGSDTVVGGVN